MQQIQYVENSQSKATKNLVYGLPVKKDEKPCRELFSARNLTAVVMIGLSWILTEGDF